MIAELSNDELEALLTRALAADLGPDARARIRAHLPEPLAHRPRLLSRRRRSVATIALAAALVIAGTAAGVRYFGEWGPVDHPATVAEIEQEIQAGIEANVLPPGYSYPLAQIRAATEFDGGRALHVGTLNVQQHYMCAWTDYWLAASDRGDAGAANVALHEIETFPNLMLIGDPRFADDSIRDEIAEVVAGARAGARAPVQELWSAACSDAMVIRP